MFKENNKDEKKKKVRWKEKAKIYNRKTGPKNKHRTKATSNDLLKLQIYFNTNRL